MSRNNKALTEERLEVSTDNQIRLDVDKIREKGQQIEAKYMKISENHPILEQLILLALPSPSRHVH